MMKTRKMLKKEHIKKVQSRYNKIRSDRRNEITKHLRGLKGKLFEWNFICDLCGHQRTKGYLYNDGSEEYEICKFCNDRLFKRANFTRIIYTPMGNKR